MEEGFIYTARGGFMHEDIIRIGYIKGSPSELLLSFGKSYGVNCVVTFFRSNDVYNDEQKIKEIMIEKDLYYDSEFYFYCAIDGTDLSNQIDQTIIKITGCKKANTYFCG